MNQHQMVRQDKILRNSISEYWRKAYGVNPNFIDKLSSAEVKILWKDLKKANRV